jgi:hypothetical protein
MILLRNVWLCSLSIRKHYQRAGVDFIADDPKAHAFSLPYTSAHDVGFMTLVKYA